MDSVKYKPLVVCIELNPFKHESERWVNTHPSNQRTKTGSEAQASFRHEPNKETHATETLYKDAPPSALMIIPFVKIRPSTSQ